MGRKIFHNLWHAPGKPYGKSLLGVRNIVLCLLRAGSSMRLYKQIRRLLFTIWFK